MSPLSSLMSRAASVLAVTLTLALAACGGGVSTPGDDGGANPSDAGGSGATGDGGGSTGDGDAGMPGPDAGGMDAGTPDAGAGPMTQFVYVGSGDGNIYAFELDSTAGTLTARGSFAGGTNPSFLAFHPTQPKLYAVNETSPGAIVAFDIDPATGALTKIDQASSGGDGPAHVSVDRAGKVVLAANYGSGTVAVLPIQSNGGVGDPSDTKSPGANAHQIVADPSNESAFVPCLGADLVAQYKLDPVAGKLTPNATPSVPSETGSGPRHLDFTPDAKFAYLVHETANTITAMTFDVGAGRLTPFQTLSTLPANATGTSYGAEVTVHPNGKFVFVSNRGHDSIAVFSIDGATGALTPVGDQPTGGSWPRSFGLSPDGSILLVANQKSGTITGFRVEETTGALTDLGVVANVPNPAFVGVRALAKP